MNQGAKVMIEQTRRHLALGLMLIVAIWGTLAFADAEHPTATEVSGLVEVLNFRSEMVANSSEAIGEIQAKAPRETLQRIAGHMETAGSGANGWRFLLGTSVFTSAGLTDQTMLTVFYNPWIDTALFTEWRLSGNGRVLSDVEWVAGDMVRAQDAVLDPRPLWLRNEGYRPNELVNSVVTTVRAIEERFGQPFGAENWRGLLGLEDMTDIDDLLSPLLAMRLYETQMRLAALAVPTEGEDPLLKPLREAVAALIGTAAKDGFGSILSGADQTSDLMRKALLAINPVTMQGLAPVAFVVGDRQAMVFLSSILTTDFTIAVRFEETAEGYEGKQIEYIPYAATYQAASISDGDGGVEGMPPTEGDETMKSSGTITFGRP
jgi:hypothetical protein